MSSNGKPNGNPGGAEACLGSLKLGGVLAVLPIDAFTGKTILARDFSVEIAGAGPPIRKSDGYFVFTQVLDGRGAKHERPSAEDTVLSIRLSGRGYREERLRVTAAEVPRKEPVVTVRMNPDASYPFPPDTICLKGRLSAGCRLCAALLQKEGSLRLAEDYHAGEGSVAVYCGGKRNLEGSLLYMEMQLPALDAEMQSVSAAEDGMGREKTCGSFLMLREAAQDGRGRFRLSAPLADEFDRLKTRLYPARIQEAGEEETHYFFAFRRTAAVQAAMTPDRKTAIADCDMLCRVETPEGIRDYRFQMEGGGTRTIDFGKEQE